MGIWPNPNKLYNINKLHFFNIIKLNLNKKFIIV